MSHRRSALEAMMQEHDVRHMLLRGANRFGSAVQRIMPRPTPNMFRQMVASQ